jgi:endoglucanase
MGREGVGRPFGPDPRRIRNRLVVDRFGGRLLLPGFRVSTMGRAASRSASYFIWPALDLFSRLDGEGHGAR